VKTNFPFAPISVAGSPNEVADGLDQYRQAGLEYAICLFESEDVDDYLRQIRVFAEKIMPHFADAP
jgi:hypothetical protein